MTSNRIFLLKYQFFCEKRESELDRTRTRANWNWSEPEPTETEPSQTVGFLACVDLPRPLLTFKTPHGNPTWGSHAWGAPWPDNCQKFFWNFSKFFLGSFACFLIEKSKFQKTIDLSINFYVKLHKKQIFRSNKIDFGCLTCPRMIPGTKTSIFFWKFYQISYNFLFLSITFILTLHYLLKPI